jgi:hypothetical protein
MDDRSAGTGNHVPLLEVIMSTTPVPPVPPLPDPTDPDRSFPGRSDPDNDPDITPFPDPEPQPDEDPDEQLPRPEGV